MPPFSSCAPFLLCFFRPLCFPLLKFLKSTQKSDSLKNPNQQQGRKEAESCGGISMKTSYEKFMALPIKKELLCLEQGDITEPYFCYPANAKPIGFEGCILYWNVQTLALFQNKSYLYIPLRQTLILQGFFFLFLLRKMFLSHH